MWQFQYHSDTSAFVIAGNKDWLKPAGTEVLKSFENNVTINHRFGHTVPRLGVLLSAILTSIHWFLY